MINLKDNNISYILNNETIKLLNFNPNSMILEVAIFNKDTFIRNSKVPFAHLPKKLKAKLNPK
ncbi:MAG TPA: malate dehydrogenase [Aliarcobacter thereius]|nr:malate dehydrogenase [Aliarcobacter thereius]HJE02797.1 malate dehydrogenase [Aliarcobacter thereius]